MRDAQGLRELLSGWVDDRVGVIRSLVTGESSADAAGLELPVAATAYLASYTEGRPRHVHDPQVASGKGLTAVDALIGAAGEAIERYSAARYRREDLRLASWNGLGEEGLDPRQLCLYDEDQYREPGFPFAPFDPDRPIHWLRGSWLGSGEPVWVPALTSFFNFMADPGEHFCQVSSNGLAAGGDLEDAALRALFELVERDAFMLTWLCQLPARRIVPDGALEPGSGRGRAPARRARRRGGALSARRRHRHPHRPLPGRRRRRALARGHRGPGLPHRPADGGAQGDPRAGSRRPLHPAPDAREQGARQPRGGAVAGGSRPLLRHARAAAGPSISCAVPESASRRDPRRDPFGAAARSPRLRRAPERRRFAGGVVDVTSPDVTASPFRVARALGTTCSPSTSASASAAWAIRVSTTGGGAAPASIPIRIRWPEASPDGQNPRAGPRPPLPPEFVERPGQAAGPLDEMDRKPAKRRVYPGAERTPLPGARLRSAPLTSRRRARSRGGRGAISRSRRSRSKPSAACSTRAMAFRAARWIEGQSVPERPAPSGGGLYPLELYVAAQEVAGLADGLYHYDAWAHELELRRAGRYHAQLAGMTLGQEMLVDANLVVCITAVFARTQWKYGQRGYRYVCWRRGTSGRASIWWRRPRPRAGRHRRLLRRRDEPAVRSSGGRGGGDLPLLRRPAADLNVRVLVCGTRYGSAYVNALWGHDAGLRLVGIVARGSDRSRDLAARCGVPLYRAASEVPRGGVDSGLRGGARRGRGLTLAMDFLRRGAHVLAEHPAEPADLAAALAEARTRGLVYHLNAHFADLETVWPFLAVCARATERPLFLTVATNPRALYSSLDLVGRALGGLSPFAVRGALAGDGPLAAVHGSAAGVPFSIQCQSHLTERDDGRETWVSHRVALTWGTGTLHLLEAAGPVLWMPVAGPVEELPPAEAAAVFAQPAWSLLSPALPPTLREHLADHRDRANRLALRRLAIEVRTGHRAPEQDARAPPRRQSRLAGGVRCGGAARLVKIMGQTAVFLHGGFLRCESTRCGRSARSVSWSGPVGVVGEGAGRGAASE